MENPFTVKVYDKDLNFKGFVGDPITLMVTPRYNQVGTATLEVDINHRLADALSADGARLVIFKDDLFVMSGKIIQKNGEGPAVRGVLRLYVKSDFRLLNQILGWPVPANALTAQTSEYATYTGTAESIVKAVVTANMTNRLGMNVACTANLDRGAAVPGGVKLRFHPLFERLYPAIETAGIGVTFEQSGTEIVCDVFVPPVFGPELTEESGILQWWSWTSTDPTATRVVAGGKNEGTARNFLQKINGSAESAHHDIVEVFRDARDADNDTVLDARAQETLDEGRQQAGFAVRLSESETYRYGKNGLVVGATVTISVAGITRTDTLREVTLSYTRADGVEVTPVIGEVHDSPDRTIANFLVRLKKSVSDLKVSK